MKNLEKFKNLVQLTIKKGETFYSYLENSQKPNPYYIGFGNPNSKILIIGKEMGFDHSREEHKKQLKAESIDNSIQWQSLITNDIWNGNFKFIDSSYYEEFFNPIIPYSQINKGGHTWRKYNELVKKIIANEKLTPSNSIQLIPFNGLNREFKNTNFLLNSFITELNTKPSKTSEGKLNEKDKIDRLMFLNHPFYESFEVVILAFGSYMSKEDVETNFKTRFIESKSNKTMRQKLEIYKDSSNKIIIQTNQLSMAVRNTYLIEIAESINKYLNL